MSQDGKNDMTRPDTRANSGRLDKAERGAPKKHNSSKVGFPFVVSWRRQGKRKRWYFATEEEADEKLKTLQETIAAEGAEGVHFGAVARAEWYAANKILEPLGASVIEAARFYAKHHESRSDSIDWKQATLSYFEELERGNRRQVTIDGNKRRLKAFEDFAQPRTLGDLDPQTIREFLSQPGFAPGTVAAYRLALSGIASHCKRRGWINKNPIDEIPAPKLDQGKPSVWAVREANAILAASARLKDGRILKQQCLRILAGLRPGEAERIEAENIGTDSLRVNVGKIRGRRSVRIVSLSPAFRAWWSLAEEKKSPLHPANFRKLNDAAIKAAGVTTRGKDITRHTWISCALATMHDENKVARMAGNSPAVIYSNYFQLIDEAEAARLGTYSPLDPKGQE
jgi:integrase